MVLDIPQIILLVGSPGSGKTTWALDFLKDHPDYVRVSQDDQGDKQHFINFQNAICDRKSVIIDRMDFDQKQRYKYLSFAKDYGYCTKIVVFHVSQEECLNRCILRENHPSIKSAESAKKAIGFFFKYYERVRDYEADVIDRLGWDDHEHKPTALIIDLDGTLSDSSGRMHYLQETKKNWDGFFENLDQDPVNKWCKEIVERFAKDSIIIILTGRPEDKCKAKTKTWLKENGIEYDELMMRKKGDYRRDDDIKEMIYEFEIKPYYNVLFALEDRQRVTEMWRKQNVVCLQCEGEKI